MRRRAWRTRHLTYLDRGGVFVRLRVRWVHRVPARGIRAECRCRGGVAKDSEHDAGAGVAVAAVKPAGVADDQALPGVEVDDLLVLGDDGAQQGDQGGGLDGEHGQVVEAEPDACPSRPGQFADGAEVAARGAEVGGAWSAEGPQGGGVLSGEGDGDMGGVGQQGVPAAARGLLACEQEQTGRVGQAGPVGVRDQLGVGERAVAGVRGLGVGDHGDAVRPGVTVGPDAHQSPR